MPLRNCDSYIKKFKLLESCFWILINHRKKLPACLYMLLPCACSRFWSLKKSKGSPYTCWLYIGTTVAQQNKFCNSFKSPKLSAQEDLTSSGSMIHASWESRCYLVSQVFFQTIFFLEWLKFIIYIVSLGTELGKLSKYGCLTMGIKNRFPATWSAQTAEICQERVTLDSTEPRLSAVVYPAAAVPKDHLMFDLSRFLLQATINCGCLITHCKQSNGSNWQTKILWCIIQYISTKNLEKALHYKHNRPKYSM